MFEDKLPRTNYFVNLNIDKTKNVRLSLIYSREKNDAVLNFIKTFVAIPPQTLIGAITQINTKIVKAVQTVFSSPIIERLLGSAFNANLSTYIELAPIQTTAWVGAFKIKAKGIELPEEKKMTVPVANDIRLSVNLLWLENASIAQLSSVLLHEIVHVLDENSTKQKPTDKELARISKTAQETVLSNRLRDEGIAVFSEIINSPNSKLNLFNQKLFQKTLKTPIADFDALVKNLRANNTQIYDLGTIMLLQLFVRFVNEPDAIFQKNRLRQLLIEKQTIAITVLQTAKMLNAKKFFKFYSDNIQQRIFSDEVLQELMNT